MIYGMMNASRRAISYYYDGGKFSMIPRWNLMIRIDDSNETAE